MNKAKRVVVFGASVVIAAMVGCSAGGDAEDDDQFTSGAGAGSSAIGAAQVGATGSVGSGTGSTSSGGNNCADNTEFVYVIDIDDRMYRFDPTNNTPSAFSLIGPMNCGAGQGPNSMSVARDGTAYVLYGTDQGGNDYDCAGVYAVDISDATCLGKTSVICGSGGFDKFGMGFATIGPGSETEELFLANSFTGQLGKADLPTGNITAVGNLSGPAEFTGNGNGELWGYFPQQFPPQVIQVDKTSGAALTTFTLNGLPPPGGAYAYAFATWGGEFYVFYWVDGAFPSTRVYRVDANGNLSTHIDNSGLVIVGAGVSTCAPVTPPN